MSLKLNHINHVAVIASDYQKSKNFYVEVLGLKVINETYRAHRDSYKLDLQVDEHSQIELFSFPNPPSRITNPEATGLRHLAFEVDSVSEAYHYLKTQNIEVEEIRIDEITNKKFTFFRDPDDLPIEVYER